MVAYGQHRCNHPMRPDRLWDKIDMDFFDEQKKDELKFIASLSGSCETAATICSHSIGDLVEATADEWLHFNNVIGTVLERSKPTKLKPIGHPDHTTTVFDHEALEKKKLKHADWDFRVLSTL